MYPPKCQSAGFLPASLMQNRTAAGTSAFSLTELLLATAIVVVLVILAVSSAGSIRKKANGVRCSSNLRDMTFGCLKFAQDHNGLIAATRGSGAGPRQWWLELRPYLGHPDPTDSSACQTLICPSDPDLGTKATVPQDAPDPKNWRSYSVNANLENKKLLSIVNPARKAYAADLDAHKIGSYYIRGEPTWLNAVPRDRHNNKVYFSFLDGHTELLSVDSLYPGKENNVIF